MKKIILSLALAVMAVVSLAAGSKREPVIAVEEKFELNSIVWRLAGANEYSQCNLPVYAADIDTFFAPYRNHPIIKYCNDIRAATGVSYDAVSTMSGLLTIRGGHVVAVSDTAAAFLVSRDKRWSVETFTEYVRLLDDFYRTSNFKKFFRRHRSLYRLAESEFRNKVMMPGTGWFVDFWGHEVTSYTVYLSLTNGSSNYGDVPVEGSDNAVLVGCAIHNDSLSLPVTYDPSTISILVHELMHKVANPVAAKYEYMFADAIDSIYPGIAGRLMNAAYDRPSVMPEWFTRLGTICFMKDNNLNAQYIDRTIDGDEYQGFVWQKKAYQLMLDSFYTDRTKYRYFEDFVPQLSAFLTEFVADSANFLPVPEVVDCMFNIGKEVEEISLSALDTLKVAFIFSEDMDSRYGVQMVADNQEVLNANCKLMQERMTKEQIYVWRDKRTFEVVVPTEYLKGLGMFAIRLHLYDFQSERGVGGFGFAMVRLPVTE